MLLFDESFDSPAANIAFDEALLDAAEAGEFPGAALRLWESTQYFVVLGRSSSAEIEVDLDVCRDLKIHVLRRSSGGGTVVAGPGCLMYAIVLPFETHPQLRAVDVCHQFVLKRMTQSLLATNSSIQAAGTSDLTISAGQTQQKFSGNAMRCKRAHVLYHGTILYDFDLQLLNHLLATPTREPDYRNNRKHQDFVTNLKISASEIRTSFIDAWQANETAELSLEMRTNKLIATKYTSDSKWIIYQPIS